MASLKVGIIFAILLSAAVLLPLRRAQRAFATSGGMLSGAVRPGMRRRPSGPRADARKARTSTVQAMIAESRLSAAKAADRATSTSNHSVHSEREFRQAGHTGHATHFDWDVADLASSNRTVTAPDRLETANVTAPVPVPTQAVGEIPDPPPKRTLL